MTSRHCLLSSNSGLQLPGLSQSYCTCLACHSLIALAWPVTVLLHFPGLSQIACHRLLSQIACHRLQLPGLSQSVARSAPTPAALRTRGYVSVAVYTHVLTVYKPATNAAAAPPYACFALIIAQLLAVFGPARLHALHTGVPFAGPLPARSRAPASLNPRPDQGLSS
eukprot:366435-Chlamydomonas_euryale.AAC.8